MHLIFQLQQFEMNQVKKKSINYRQLNFSKILTQPYKWIRRLMSLSKLCIVHIILSTRKDTGREKNQISILWYLPAVSPCLLRESGCLLSPGNVGNRLLVRPAQAFQN